MLATAASISNKPEASGLHFHIQISLKLLAGLQTSWPREYLKPKCPRLGLSPRKVLHWAQVRLINPASSDLH
jgi:hypothetical protein